MRKVTLIPGDGIGPEIVEAVRTIFKAVEAPIEWEEMNIGKTAFETEGALIPERVIESIKQNKVALKGPTETPVGKGFRSVNVQLRQMFELYANIRPCQTLEGIASRYDKVDLVIFRENTEGLYSGLNYFDERLRIADSISRVTEKGCERIVKAAFKYADAHKAKKITAVHKANILKHSGSLLLTAAKNASQDYPNITLEDKIIDNMAMQLVVRPEQFEVIVTSNLFGDILSDLCAGLVGGLGVVPGANIGDDIAIFEAVHGTAPDIAGKGLANPTALLRSGIMMLRYLEEKVLADQIENALFKTLKDKNKVTGDLGGKANTRAFTNFVIENL